MALGEKYPVESLQIAINPQNMSKGQAEAAMLAGHKISHISWDKNEYLYYSKISRRIIDESDAILGDFDCEVWQKEQTQQWGWLIVE